MLSRPKSGRPTSSRTTVNGRCAARSAIASNSPPRDQLVDKLRRGLLDPTADRFERLRRERPRRRFTDGAMTVAVRSRRIAAGDLVGELTGSDAAAADEKIRIAQRCEHRRMTCE